MAADPTGRSLSLLAVRGVRYAGSAVLAALGAVVLLAFGERALAGDHVLHGVRLAGVSVAGRDLDEARAAIAEHAWQLENARFEAVAGGRRFTFTAGEVGLVVDEDAAMADVTRAGRRGNPLAQVAGAVLRRFRPDRVPLDVTYDPDKLERTLRAWAEDINAPAQDGSVTVEGATVAATAAQPGRTLDLEGTATLVRRALTGNASSPLILPVEFTEPAIGTEQVEATAGAARRILSAPVTVTVESAQATLPPERMGDLLHVVADDGRLRLELPADRFHEALRPQLRAVEVAPRDARFVIEQAPSEPPPTPGPATPNRAPAPPAGAAAAAAAGDPAAPRAGDPAASRAGDPGAPPAPPAPGPAPPPAPPPPPTVRIEESATGLELDVAPVVEAVLQGEHHIIGHLVKAAPRIDTALAETLRIIEPVSTFTTRHPAGQPRVKNIHRIADLVDGTVILPGERFSLNEAVGPRTKAKGFVEAPVIYEGEFTEDVGGGVSQFATTFFNAAFFGGYELVSHKAHTYYISRYPHGREATVSFPQPDLVIRNDSSSGILVKASYTASSITVTFWGDKEGRTVRAEGPKVGRRTSKGYSVSVVRVIERPGAEPVRQSIVTYYRTQRRKATSARPATPRSSAPAAGPAPRAAEPVPPPPRPAG